MLNWVTAVLLSWQCAMQLAKILLMSPGSCRHAKLGVRRMNEAAQVDHMQ